MERPLLQYQEVNFNWQKRQTKLSKKQLPAGRAADMISKKAERVKAC